MRRALIALLVVVAAAGTAAFAAQPAAAVSNTRLLKERIVMLRGSIDRFALAHTYNYPAVQGVRKGGTLPVAFWPTDPWSGAPMTPGTGRGHFRYTVAGDRRSFALTGYYPGGTYTVRGSMPDMAVTAYAHRSHEGLSLIQQYVEEWARLHDDLYPPASEVAEDRTVGLLSGAAWWPSNPWTHALMSRSTNLGDFSYDVGPGRLSYTLTLHGKSGDWRLRSPAVDPWRAMRLALQDEAVRTATRLLDEYLRDIATGLGRLPTVEELTHDSAIGSFYDWPADPFSDQSMTAGPAPGQYTYVPSPDGSYVLAGHQSDADVTIQGPPADWAAHRDYLTIQGVTAIGNGIEMWSVYNGGVYPAPEELAPSGAVGALVDPWPRNPYTDAFMAVSADRGDFAYSVSPDGLSYTLQADLADGESYDVAQWTSGLWEPMHRIRISLKDLCAQGYAQVLKDYVVMWTRAHGGTLPRADEMSAAGAVGQAQTWWPVSPWSGAPMGPGTDVGDFAYTPGANGAFTLVLYQQALPDLPGSPGSGYPPTYTAQ